MITNHYKQTLGDCQKCKKSKDYLPICRGNPRSTDCFWKPTVEIEHKMRTTQEQLKKNSKAAHSMHTNIGKSTPQDCSTTHAHV